MASLIALLLIPSLRCAFHTTYRCFVTVSLHLAFQLHPMLWKPVELVPATARDLAVLAPMHRRAFAPMPVTRFLYTNVQPAPAVHEQFFQFAFGYVLAGAQARPDGGSVMTVARQGNQTLGFAWSTREPAAQDRPPATNQSQGSNIPGADPVRTRELYGTLEQHSRSIPFAHWSRFE